MTKKRALRIICDYVSRNPEPEFDVVIAKGFNEDTSEFEDWTYYGLLRFIEEERAKAEKRGPKPGGFRRKKI